MGRGTAVAVLAMVAAVGAASTAGARGVEACPAPAGDVSGLPNPGGGVPNGYLLVNGHVPRRRRAPGGPGFRVRARAGDVLRIDYPLTACAPGGGTWFENLGTLFVIDRRARPATSRDFRVLGSSGIATPVAIPGGVQWPYGELPAGQWAHRIVRLQLERRGRLYLVAGHGDAGWYAPGADPPQNLQGGGKPDRQSRHDPYTVQVDVGRAPRVYATACATTRQRLLVRAPSRHVARAGRPRVRLHPSKRLCAARTRLKGRAAARALAFAPVRPAKGPSVPALAGCLLTPDTSATGPGEWLLSRRAWCSQADVISVRSVVIAVTPGGTERRVVGTGLLALSRRIDLAPGGTRGRLTAGLGYRGLSGNIEGGATFALHADCEFAFGTTCSAQPDGGLDPRPFVLSGGTAQGGWDLGTGAQARGGRDFMQLWLRVEVHALLAGYAVPATIAVNPRPRCDTELTARQECVFGDFAASVPYSRAAMPEIAAHIAHAQAAGQPGARGGRALHRRRSGIRRRRREACPTALVKRFRRERAGGSCDEYPFASTQEGGRGASVANVPQGEQHAQGGTMAAFYGGQRILDGDPFFVAVTP